MQKHRNTILGTIVMLLAIIGTVFAMSDRFIAKATFVEFKEHVIYRLDNIDNKLDQILLNKGGKE